VPSQSFNLPGDLRFNIAEFSDEAFPGLSDEYVLQEIKNVTVTYDDIRDQAEAINLPHLLRYLTQVDYLKLFRNLSELKDEVRSHKHDWSKLINSIDDPDDIWVYRPGHGATNYTVTIMLGSHVDRRSSIEEYLRCSPEGIHTRSAYNCCIIELPKDLLDEFIQQQFLINCQKDSLLYSRVLFNPQWSPESDQYNIHTRIQDSDPDHQLSTTELMEVLRYQRKRYDLVQSILNTRDITSPLKLSVIEYMLANNITSRASSGNEGDYITVTCSNVILPGLRELLLRIDTSCMIIESDRCHIVELKAEQGKNIRSLWRHVQLIHNPLMMTESQPSSEVCSTHPNQLTHDIIL